MSVGGRAGFSGRAAWQGSLRPILVVTPKPGAAAPARLKADEGSASVAGRLHLNEWFQEPSIEAQLRSHIGMLVTSISRANATV
jgi:hypothetical protein